MVDKVNNTKDVKKKTVSPEQRSRRMQQIMFGGLAIIMIFSMVISLIVK
jgi:hypothetical protein